MRQLCSIHALPSRQSGRLYAYARKHAIPSRGASEGLCFHTAVCLARYAKKLGLGDQVFFVRWRLRGDRVYREHWAVCYSPGQVLDLTAAQIDGDPEPKRPLHAYPASFGEPRAYPADVVLLPLGRVSESSNRYSEQLLWQVHRRIAWFDLRAALRRKAPAAVASEALRLANTALVLVASHLLNCAIRRLVYLMRKLRPGGV